MRPPRNTPQEAAPDRLSARVTLLLALALPVCALLCICVGSVSIPPAQTLSILADALLGREGGGTLRNIIVSVRVPRVLASALMGASLSLCGAAMQGLLRNPLADGSTLGVSSGASLGAVTALTLGLALPGFPLSGVMVMAMLFAFLSLLAILSLAYALDRSLATASILLIGVVFSMFASSVMSLMISFAGEKARTVVFWTMGSLSGVSYVHVGILLAALLLCGGVLLLHARELNAFAIGEETARHIGVNVRRVKLTVLACVSVLIGVCVSIGGSIGFVGLITPHLARMVAGPNHRRLLPASLLSGAAFLMLADLVSRTLLRPIELPIGVVTSIIGAAACIVIFCRARKGG